MTTTHDATAEGHTEHRHHGGYEDPIITYTASDNTESKFDSIRSNASYDLLEIENKNQESTMDIDDAMTDPSDKNFHLGDQSVSTLNVHVSPRRTCSFQEFGDVYEHVPTKLKPNRKLVIDLNLHPTEKGKLYLAEQSFYRNQSDTKYAMTIHPDIYQNVMEEVHDAHTVPCGLYFCCHGGDGAHTGVSHDDYVDIRLAWAVVSVLFVTIWAVEIGIPPMV